MTTRERIQAHRDARVAAGWKQVNLWLTPEARVCLDEINQRLEIRGETKTQNEIILDCILKKGL